jgi:3-oxoacyl-[acyl-carrier-protein] synthase-3
LRARVVGTGSYTPGHVLTNHDLEEMVDTSDEWITERTGIKERRIAAEDENTSDLAYEASVRALRDAGVKPKDVDLIVLATMTADMPVPATACILQNKLEAKRAVAFDVGAACSGFLFALSVAENYVKTGAAGRVLVVGAEVLSRFVNWQDRSTCVLFGDGAGAVVLAPAEGDEGILSVELHSDGSLGNLLCLPGGGARSPASPESLQQGLHYIHMKGNELFKVAVKSLEKAALECLKKNKMKPSEVSLLVPHQANLRIIQATANRLKLPMERVMVNLQTYGNTSAASIPLALDEAVRTRRVRDGDYVLMEAFGGGLTWASALVKWAA